MYERRGGGGLGGLFAFLVGGLIGAAIGMLFAPKAGKETRDELMQRADEMMDQGRDVYEEQRGRVMEAVETGKKTAAEKSEDIREKIGVARDKLKEGIDTAAEYADQQVESLKKKTEKQAEEEAPPMEEAQSEM
jgi:gas vesicle protein